MTIIRACDMRGGDDLRGLSSSVTDLEDVPPVSPSPFHKEGVIDVAASAAGIFPATS